MIDDTTCLLLFVKYPDKGKVKSRLSNEFGEDTVLRLYEAFVHDILETMNKGKYRFKSVSIRPLPRRR